MTPEPALSDSGRRLLRHARREAWLILAVWGVFLVWVVGYCYLRGYLRSSESALVQSGLAAARSRDDFGLVLGLPDWVFWGIALPWAIATAVTLWFGARVLRDDPLEDADAGAAPALEG